MEGGEYSEHIAIEIGHPLSGNNHESRPLPHIKVTPYRFLNTALPSAFVLSKAILGYKGESMVPTTLELIAAVFVGNMCDLY
jgi:hypothetical protein